MFRVIDRLLILSFLKSYCICLFSLLGLYLVVDLFNNIDDFTRVKGGFGETLEHIGMYYAIQTTFIFDQLSEAIILLGAVFTMAWMQRNNEVLPLLSAGVSTRRIIRPVLFSACLMVFVNIANQEFLIPELGAIPITRGDPNHEKGLVVRGAFDSNDIFVTGRTAVRNDLHVDKFNCDIPNTIAPGSILHLQAERAFYIPPKENQPRTGGWKLTKTSPLEFSRWNRPDVLEQIDEDTYFLYTDVDFDTVTRDSRKWFQKQSTYNVYREMNKGGSNRQARMAVFFHMRLTRPILGMILVIMGLSIILRDQNRNVFISAGFCLILCAAFYTATITGKYLGDKEFVAPAMAAWLPVFVFGPLAFVLFDAIHT